MKSREVIEQHLNTFNNIKPILPRQISARRRESEDSLKALRELKPVELGTGRIGRDNHVVSRLFAFGDHLTGRVICTDKAFSAVHDDFFHFVIIRFLRSATPTIISHKILLF